MKNVIAIRREDDNKKGEKRVAITPEIAGNLVNSGFDVLIQPAISPTNNETKRIFDDEKYISAGARLSENIDEANIIVGLKEIHDHENNINSNKAYFKFSHTHKGQKKNMNMLRSFVNKKATLVDYELITNEQNQRSLTAFTFSAGHAGMVDTLWALGEKLKRQGVRNNFEVIKQAVVKEDLNHSREVIRQVGESIKNIGTPAELPPVITCFCGRGRTSAGAQSVYDEFGGEEITLDQLEDVFNNGSKNKVYKLVLEVYDMFRLKENSLVEKYNQMSDKEKFDHYINNPEMYESNLDRVLPYITVLMNCVLWSEKYPRLVTRKLMNKIYSQNKNLQVVGDITCDPEGAIEFSKETWIDNPVYTYDPATNTNQDGFSESGVVVMAITNLPCEFSADASHGFCKNLSVYFDDIINANFIDTLEESNLPDDIKRAVIVWNGEFTENFKYMREFIS